MARYAKTSLYPDTPLYGTTPDGKRVSVSFTSADSQHLHNRVKEMLSYGLQIPVAIEHQDSAKPMTPDEWDRYRAEKAWATCGYLVDAELMPNGQLRLVFEVPNDSDAQRVEVIKYVSPEIMTDFMDGSGRVWDGMSITHLAVTPRPVQHIQDRVTRLSLAQRNIWPGTIRLSLGAENMADEYDDLDVETTPEEEMETETDETPEFEEEETEEVEMDDESVLRDQVTDRLAEMGIMIPKGITDNLEFYKALDVALMNQEGAEPDGDEEIPEEDFNPDDEFVASDTAPEGVNEAQNNSPVMLSLTREKKTRSVYEAKLIAHHKATIRKRIDRVAKADPEFARELEQQLPAVRFSLDAKGEVKRNAFTVQLETAEKCLTKKRLRPNDQSTKRFSVAPKGTSEAQDTNRQRHEAQNADAGDHVKQVMTGHNYVPGKHWPHRN